MIHLSFQGLECWAFTALSTLCGITWMTSDESPEPIVIILLVSFTMLPFLLLLCGRFTKRFPVAAAGINVTHLLFEKLCRVENSKKATTKIEDLYHSSAEFQTDLMNWFCESLLLSHSHLTFFFFFPGRIDKKHPFEELYLIVMILLDASFV